MIIWTHDLVLLMASLTTALCFFAVFIVYLFIRTPVSAFLKKGITLIKPSEDRSMKFISGKNIGGIVVTKKDSSHILDPNDVFIEPKSKKPVAIVYGNMGISLNPKYVQAMQYLKANGILNYEQLEKTAEKLSGAYRKQYENLQELYKNLTERLSKTEDAKEKRRIAKEIAKIEEQLPLLQEKIEKPLGSIVIDGESVNLNNVLDYMQVSRRQGDLIEAGIQRVVAVEKSKQRTDWIKWLIVGAVAIAIVMIAGSIALSIFSSHGATLSIDYNALAQAISGAKASAPTGTGIS